MYFIIPRPKRASCTKEFLPFCVKFHFNIGIFSWEVFLFVFLENIFFTVGVLYLKICATGTWQLLHGFFSNLGYRLNTNRRVAEQLWFFWEDIAFFIYVFNLEIFLYPRPERAKLANVCPCVIFHMLSITQNRLIFCDEPFDVLLFPNKFLVCFSLF